MRIVALEEHFAIPELTKRIDPSAIQRRGFPVPGSAAARHMPHDKLADLGSARLADMDAAGISVQILSVSGPGADLVAPDAAPQLAREFNDRLARTIGERPDRYRGFAHLPMTAPQAAADELERCVTNFGFKGALINGLTDDRFLDDPRFEPILARAETLDVPIYLHPGLPPEAVRKAYYDDLPAGAGMMLAMAGWGWHSEVAIHVLRLVLAGSLDRHPRLKLIIGHMGEGLPAMLKRCDDVFERLPDRFSSRSASKTILDHVWITASGFFSLPPFMAALLTFGVDRILFSVDYPFSQNKVARDFLDALPLGYHDIEKVAHGNADDLLKLA